MLNIIRKLTTSIPLITVPAVAADLREVPTGITGIGPSMFIFTVAGAVLLTLVFRASARHVTRHVGERAANRRVRLALQTAGRRLRSDFLLPGAYGGIAKIDHAVLSPGGILCIRALHASGIVAGGENEPQWTLTDGAKRRRFLNPLIQNEGRARALRNILPEVPVTNLVVFTGRVEWNGEQPPNVVHLDELKGRLAQYRDAPGRITEPDAVWLNLTSSILEGSDARKDFAAQISFS